MLVFRIMGELALEIYWHLMQNIHRNKLNLKAWCHLLVSVSRITRIATQKDRHVPKKYQKGILKHLKLSKVCDEHGVPRNFVTQSYKTVFQKILHFWAESFFPKFCGLLRIYEVYWSNWSNFDKFRHLFRITFCVTPISKKY